MIIHDVKQGSPEWHALRATTRNASEAPAMMGVSKYKTRAALIAEKATGIIPEVDEPTQRRFDAGHETEAKARAIIEERLGEDLYPLVATDDEVYLLASSDGSDMCRTFGFEHKLWNAEIAEQVAEGNVPDSHKWQLDQQIEVFGFDKIIFVCSDGTSENFVCCEYFPQPERIEALKAGWKQFDEDVANYQPEAIEAKPILTAKPIERLPALFVEVTGRVMHSNLVEFKAAATSIISGIKTELVTDQDFVDAIQTVKDLRDIEDNAKRAKQNALEQTVDIAELHRALDEVAGMAATVRKALDKKITEEKDARKAQIVRDAQLDFNDHYASLADRVGVAFSVAYVAFAEAIKGLKSLDSMRDKVSVALANAKIEANAIADRIEFNIKTLEANGDNWRFLFPDLSAVCAKAKDDFAALLSARIAAHKEAEAKRLEQEREKIRAEEQAKAQREAADALSRKNSEAEAANYVAVASCVQETEKSETQPALSIVNEQQASTDDCLPRIKLGEINARLGVVSVTADQLEMLGFKPVATDKNAKLYEERQFATICRKIQEHLGAVMMQSLKRAA